MLLRAGLDWGATGHAVRVTDDRGAILARFECAHTASGLAELLGKLNRIIPAGDLPVAIERASGLVVETLAAAGHPVVPIHSNVVEACRPRHRAAGGKPDPGDAYMPADITHRLRKVFTGSADDARHRSPWAADAYGPAPKRGCDHPHAIRLLARAWLRILWKAWTERTLCDPANHQAPLSLAART